MSVGRITLVYVAVFLVNCVVTDGRGDIAIDLVDSTAFETFLVQYGKQYQPNEHVQRYKLFSENLKRIDEINVKNEVEGRRWTAGINQFTDMSVDEWRSTRTSKSMGQKCSATSKFGAPLPFDKRTISLPASIDWRSKNVITPVKNQGNCGSCWTFSTTGCLEAHTAIVKGQLISISEQNLIDCASAFDNHGCNGGLPSQAFEYIRYNGGIEAESDYPYKTVDQICKFDKLKVAATVSGVMNITEGVEAEIQIAVGTVGPVSIAYDCDDGFMHYIRGIFSSDVCSKKSDQVNHAVLAVGYGTEDGVDYWIVKNSWGVAFGENGYFRIARGQNECGLAQCASYPII